MRSIKLVDITAAESGALHANKREFHDAIRMRYRWPLGYLSSICSCGKRFSVDHALSFLKGGFIHRRHDEIRDLFGQLTTEISHDVEIEPALLPLTEQLHATGNGQDEGRLNLSIGGFWERGQRACFDGRVFNRPTETENSLPPFQAMRKRENIEHGTFTPLAFTPYGGCSHDTENVYCCVSSSIAIKRQTPISITTNWVRSKLSFVLLQSAILCVCGSRALRKKYHVGTGSIEISSATSQIII